MMVTRSNDDGDKEDNHITIIVIIVVIIMMIIMVMVRIQIRIRIPLPHPASVVGTIFCCAESAPSSPRNRMNTTPFGASPGTPTTKSGVPWRSEGRKEGKEWARKGWRKLKNVEGRWRKEREGNKFKEKKGVEWREGSRRKGWRKSTKVQSSSRKERCEGKKLKEWKKVEEREGSWRKERKEGIPSLSKSPMPAALAPKKSISAH